jgi:4-hydroxybenzoate polyprenyltransferase
MDIISYQGDLILGRETMPLLIGSRNTTKLLLILSCTAFIAAGFSAYLKQDIFLLLFCLNMIFYTVLILQIVRKKYLVPYKYESLVEINLLIFAMISLFLYFKGTS